MRLQKLEQKWKLELHLEKATSILHFLTRFEEGGKIQCKTKMAKTTTQLMEVFDIENTNDEGRVKLRPSITCKSCSAEKMACQKKDDNLDMGPKR